MGEEIDQQLEECIRRGKLKLFSDAIRLIRKELNTAEDDLKTAEASIEEERRRSWLMRFKPQK